MRSSRPSSSRRCDGPRRTKSTVAGFALVLIFLFAPSASGQTGLRLPERGTPELSLFAGYGHWVHVNPGRSEEQLLVVQPQAGWRLGSRFEYLVEAHYAHYFRPGGWAAGLVPLGARYFFSGSAAAPYVTLGAGFCWTDLKIEELDRRFNFILQGSVGMRRSTRSDRTWLLELRWLHYSNAGTVKPNLGFNAVIFLGGWRLR